MSFSPSPSMSAMAGALRISPPGQTGFPFGNPDAKSGQYPFKKTKPLRPVMTTAGRPPKIPAAPNSPPAPRLGLMYGFGDPGQKLPVRTSLPDAVNAWKSPG